MSGDPDQDYFADGMVDEITTALSRFKSLFVIARNSSFTYKGRAVDIKQVGRELGVRYVLEGSVRKAAGKVRITGQLIDALTGAHIWADRFERDLTDVFALQDEVTVAVVTAIQPKLFQAEIAKTTRRRPENPTAYDFFLRAMQQYYLFTREGGGGGDKAGSSRFGARPSVRLSRCSGRRLSHAKRTLVGVFLRSSIRPQGSSSASSFGIERRR
jgi:adenylate cyclase